MYVSIEPSMRVLIFSLEYGPKISGGVGTHVAELAAGLVRAGCETTVVAYTPGESTMLQEDGVNVHMVSAGRSSWSNGAQSSVVEAILSINADLTAFGLRLIAEQKQRPDLIHYHNWISFPAARHCAKELEVPLVGTVHFLSEPIERWWGQTPDEEIVRQEAAQFQEPHMMITVSESMQQIIRAAHGAADDRLHVVYNGLDVQGFIKPPLAADAKNALRQSIAAQGEKIIIYAGRLNAMKGVKHLLLSAARVVEEMPHVKYLIVGEADSRDYARVIDEVFQQHPDLRKKVKLLGRIPRQQLALLYQVADIALAPSVYEPFGYSAIEAMSARLPVIASDAGGLSEIVQHKKTGLLVPVRREATGPHAVDIQELCAAQLTLLGEDELAREYGLAGYERVLQEFSREKMAQATFGIYQQAIAWNRERLFASP